MIASDKELNNLTWCIPPYGIRSNVAPHTSSIIKLAGYCQTRADIAQDTVQSSKPKYEAVSFRDDLVAGQLDLAIFTNDDFRRSHSFVVRYVVDFAMN